MQNPWNPLLDIPAYPAARYAILADRLAALLHTRNDVVLVQAEAVVALEAVATSIASPGMVALNIITSPYGSWFGQWLRRAGASVHDLGAEPGRPIDTTAVVSAIEAQPDLQLLALVHAESASGIVNPLEEIVAFARARGIVTVIDAVASVGGHTLDVDDLGIDIAVIGPQKSLGGPAGVSALSVSSRAWEMIVRAGGPSDSILSLTDARHWLDSGRGALPGTPVPLEFFALEAALDRVEAEGMANLVARHALAASATRDGLSALGARTWVRAEEASNLVTTAEVPSGIVSVDLIRIANTLGAGLTAGVGPGAGRLIRFNHTGPRASFQTVLSSVIAYGIALQKSGVDADIAAAGQTIATRYATDIEAN